MTATDGNGANIENDNKCTWDRLQRIDDGCGCVEIWEEFSDRRTNPISE